MNKKKKIIIIVSSILIVITALFLCNFKIEFDIPDEVIIIEYGQQVEKPKAYLTGRLFGKNIKELEVTSVKENDFSKIGDYENTYSAKFLFFTKTENMKVGVVDTKKPEIKLMYTNCIIRPGEEYVEEGYTAYDEYDGDLTSQVRVEKTKERWFYYVSDNSGNIAITERVLVYDDKIAPVMKLNGEEKQYVYLGEKYTEQGVKVTDNFDEQIAEKVEISGNVNTKKKGVYDIKYTVADAGGNKVTLNRKVYVIEKTKQIGKGKNIYLTFDDGPSKYTKDLLKVLKKYDVKATFFVIDGENRKVMKDIVNNGHAIGIHGTTHDYEKLYSSEEAFIADLTNMQKIIKNETGVTTYLMRFPGGSSNTVSKSYCEGIMSKLTVKVEKLGFKYFDWNVGSGDAGGTKSKEKVFKNVTDGISAGQTNSIVLQHDTKDFSIAAVEDIIIWGIENGYTFVPIDMNTPVVHHGVNN